MRETSLVRPDRAGSIYIRTPTGCQDARFSPADTSTTTAAGRSAASIGPVMRKGRRSPAGSMLSLWRPPRGRRRPGRMPGTTYTFTPDLFAERCLPYFLGIDSEPDREDLPFFLERETRLGSVYAGILVDHTQAGVEHSLRWDVLPVRVRAGKAARKLSLLVWGGQIRIVVASANLTEQGIPRESRGGRGSRLDAGRLRPWFLHRHGSGSFGAFSVSCPGLLRPGPKLGRQSDSGGRGTGRCATGSREREERRFAGNWPRRCRPAVTVSPRVAP